MRGRRAGRARRALARPARAARRRTASTPSSTATRTSMASTETQSPMLAPPQATARAIGMLGVMQDLYDEMLPGHHRAPGGVRRGGGRGAGRGGRRRRRRAGQGPRRASRRRVRELEARGVDGLLVVMLTYGPAMRVARTLARHAAAGLPRQHPARARRHARVGHGRPDVQPGHPRRAGHRQRDGARRARVHGGHRRLARSVVPGRRSARGRARRRR